MSTTPYKTAGNPKLKQSLVAFIDILGFRDETLKAFAEGRQDQLLRKLRSTLNRAYPLLDPSWPDVESDDPERSWQVKSFTDNIVLGYPFDDDGETELGQALFHLGCFQMRMIKGGFFVRGGLAVGGLYMDSDIVFGDGLIEAYRVESTIARDPRIALSPSAVSMVKKHLAFYAATEISPHNADILCDADGQLFVNYLYPSLTYDDDGPDYAAITVHKEQVEQQLRTHRDNPPVWSKYQWVARYHNYACRTEGSLNAPYLIDVATFQPDPSRLHATKGFRHDVRDSHQ